MQVVKKDIFGNLMVYSLAHFLIDATCAAVILSLFASNNLNLGIVSIFVIIYNVIAFGFQPIVGLIVDKFKCPKIFAILGSVLVGLSAIMVAYSPIIAIILAGLGNAIFHIGGGVISLNLVNKKATMPGIFVAPGAAGLLVGTLIGRSGNFTSLPFILSILIICALMLLIKQPEIDYKKEKINTNYFELALLLLLLTVVFRSVIGIMITFPWKSTLSLLIMLTLGVVLGKALGGLLGDKFGWQRVAVISLILSMPLLFFGASYPLLGILGLLFFNMTMPITLVAVSNILPGHPGFAFGLTCLALIIGGMIEILPFKHILSNINIILIIIAISTVVIYNGLKYLIR